MDALLDLIIRVMTETPKQTNFDVGDGTTTSMILAGEIVKGALGLENLNRAKFIKELKELVPIISEILDSNKV